MSVEEELNSSVAYTPLQRMRHSAAHVMAEAEQDLFPGAKFAIGTEIHLVNRVAKENPDKFVITLDDSGCLCTTMFRISPQHLCWALENLVEGRVVNPIKVKDSVKKWARVALDRMLEIQ